MLFDDGMMMQSKTNLAIYSSRITYLKKDRSNRMNEGKGNDHDYIGDDCLEECNHKNKIKNNFNDNKMDHKSNPSMTIIDNDRFNAIGSNKSLNRLLNSQKYSSRFVIVPSSSSPASSSSSLSPSIRFDWKQSMNNHLDRHHKMNNESDNCLERKENIDVDDDDGMLMRATTLKTSIDNKETTSNATRTVNRINPIDRFPSKQIPRFITMECILFYFIVLFVRFFVRCLLLFHFF